MRPPQAYEDTSARHVCVITLKSLDVVPSSLTKQEKTFLAEQPQPLNFEQTNNRTKFCESNFGFANSDPTPKCPAATSPPSRGQMGRSQGEQGGGVHHAPKRSTNENCRHADNYSNTKSLARAMPIRMCPQILGTKCEAVILASLENNGNFPCRESDSCETHHYRAKATIATSLRLVLRKSPPRP